MSFLKFPAGHSSLKQEYTEMLPMWAMIKISMHNYCIRMPLIMVCKTDRALKKAKDRQGIEKGIWSS